MSVSKKNKTINVSEEVWKFIIKSSQSLLDTPDSTLRRLLGLPMREKAKAKNE